MLTQYAEHLNAINTPAKSPRIFYEIMSGGLVWTDETDQTTPVEVIWTIRFLVAYRTGLILNKPRDEFNPIWEHALSLFPQWVGFRPESRRKTPQLLEIYRRGDVSLRKCVRDLEREMDARDS